MIEDPVLDNKDGFQGPIARRDLLQMEGKLIKDLVNETRTFSQKLDCFRERVLYLLYLGIEGESSSSDLAELFCSVQKSLSPVSPFDLPIEQTALYVGPDNLNDPLLVPSVVTDFLWILDQELGVQPGSTPQNHQRRMRLIEISKKFIEGFIPLILIKERMELEFQCELGIISDLKNAHRREVRTRTSLLYVQKKYNLFREESEGFSMLIGDVSLYLEKLKESSATGSDKGNGMQKAAREMLHRVLSLSGYYSIDPNRVLDVILDLFALNIADHWQFFLYFLEISPWINTVNSSDDAGKKCALINEVLGTKFTGHDPKSIPKKIHQGVYVMAALLVKHKLVDLDYLYSRLSPPDSEFESLAAGYRDDIKNKESSSGRFQSQSISGQLGDLGILSTAVTSANHSTAPSYVMDPVKIKGIPCHLNQKASLVKASLEIGDVRTAFLIMGRMPQIPEIYADIPELICRLLYHIIDPHDPNPVSSSRRHHANIDDCNVINTTSVRKALVSSRTTVKAKQNTPRYKYFYHLWSADLPVITDSLRFVTRCRVYLANVGVNLHRDTVTLAKLIRIGAKHVAEARRRLNNPSPSGSLQSYSSKEDKFFSVNHRQVLNSWLSLVSASILPAVSRADPNPANSYGLWQIIGEYPSKTRYALYGEWKHRIYDDYPEVRVARTACLKDCRYIMIRLSKDIIKQSGRQIAKVVHSNPVVSFTYIIRQIKSYDNMIPHIIDATRYLTDLEFDIFAYCITEALASETSSRWEGNDITIASWLKYLASFTGRLYRKHPIDLSGILMYIMSQLLKGNIYELIVLQELIGHMSGIKPLDEITHSQLDSLSGGETLKREVFFYENSKAVKKSSSRLSKALIDTGLAAKFALIIAQLRQRLTSHDPGDEYEKPQKTVIWLSDFCGKALIQYLDFMSSDLSPAAYRLAFPSFETLVGEYSLDTEYAFAISRPTLSYQLQYQNSNGTIGNNDSKQRCIDTVFKMLPGEVWEGISPDFYFEFWRLSSRDFFCPTALYNSEIRDHQKMKKSIEAELAACSTGASKFNKKIEKVSSLIRTLDSERTAQENHNKSVLEYIRKESKSWFSKSVGHNETINAMIQHCLYPRCIFSPSDAVYTAKFILLMHSLGVPNIATISLYDRLLNGDIFHAMIFSSSEDEAKSYGLFLSHTFDTLSSWRKFPELFEKEAIGVDLPGFLKKWPLKSDQNSQPNFSTAEYILHNEFRQAMRKWHLKMFRAITYCLRSNEYVRIRNSLLVLDKLSDHFPITKEMGKHLEHCVLEIEKNETREDLKQLARSYYSKMQIKKHIWVNTSDFCHLATQKPPPGDQGDSAKRSNPPAPSTPASAKPPEGSLQDNRNSGAESPLVSVLAPIDAATRNAREVNRTISVSPQHRDINSDKAVSSASSTRFSQGSRPTEKKYQAVHSSSAKENWTDSLKEEGVSSRKQTAEPAMDYSGSEKEAVMTRQAMSLEVPRSRHIHKLPSEIKDKSNVEMQLSREEPALELSQSDRKQEHPKITRNITKEHKGNRPQVIEGAERQVHHLTRYEAHGSQSDKDPYPGRLANIDYYQKRSAGEDTSIIMRNGGSHRFPIHGPRSSPSLQSPTVQAATSAHLRVQELPAIDIVSGHQPRNMNLFIMRHHNIWPRAEDGNIQQVYHNKPLKIARTTSASAAQSLPFAQSSQRTKDPSEMTSPSKKCPEDAICEDPSSKEYKSHDKDKKKIRSVERSRYSRKRKDRESDQLNAGNQDKRTSEKKPVRRYSKTYSSNFEDDPRAAPIERRDRKSHDKDPGRPAQSSTGSANVPEDIHHSPCSNHQNARGSFHHQEFQ